MSEDNDDNQNVRVMTRVRPFNAREIDISKQKKEMLRSVVKIRGKTCAVVENYLDSRGFPCDRERQAFDFDECFWSIPTDQEVIATNPFADQKFVYERSGLLALNWCLMGFNVCLFAYGQTGSGKTYSMIGSRDDPGIQPRLIDELFERTGKAIEIKTLVECSFFEIYNENVQDLFNKKNSANFRPPKIRQHPIKGVYVDGLQRKECSSAAQTKRYMERGAAERASGETKMNAVSSRSHAIFQMQVTQIDVLKSTQRISTINLIDLAGSEKIKQSQATDDRLKEATNINLSLTTLRRVIDTLIDNSKIKNPKNWKHAPYRESILTYCLSDSLGGNSKTMMIATISPHENNIEDTLNALQYALRAKSIVQHAKVNEEQSKMVLDTMRDEIFKLREQVTSGTGGGGGGSPEANAETLREIEQREAEVTRMEEEAVRMEENLKKEKEEKQEMQTEMETQKRERFAAAFRNAFLFSSQKKQHETTTAELEVLGKQKKSLENDVTIAQREVDDLRTEFNEHMHRSEGKIDTLTRDLHTQEAVLAQSKRQNSNLLDENKYLKSQISNLNAQLQSTDQLKTELEQRVVRLQNEVLQATAASDREREERRRENEAHTDQVGKLVEDIENLRRRKDKYKLTAMEHVAKADAVDSVVEALRGDRTAFLTTIKAQQSVVEEQSQVVRRYAQERREADRKTNQLEDRAVAKDDDLRIMNEALREYQNASAEFIYENYNVHRELERVKKDSEVAKGSFDSPRRSAYTPGTTANSFSPMQSRASFQRGGSSAFTPTASRPYETSGSFSPGGLPVVKGL